MVHDSKFGSFTTFSDLMIDEGSEFYKNTVEGKFSFSFNLPKSSVKIDVPEFNYKESKIHLTRDFNMWKNRYPLLDVVYRDLPAWVDKLEICYHDETVFVTLFADGEFCINNSIKVYNKIIDVKNKLIYT